MSMSTHVVGFRPADKLWEKQKAVWDACINAGVPVPYATAEFFNGEDPNGKPGVEVSIIPAVTKISADMMEGYEVNIRKLPDDVYIIRFFNSW